MSFRSNWYQSEDRRSRWLGAASNWSAVRWIITLTVAVFVLQYAEVGLLRSAHLTEWGSLRAWMPRDLDDHLAGREHGAFNWFFPVQLVSYALLHRDFWHIFFNLLFLFFFGPELEANLGKRGFFRLYLGGAVAGGLCQWAWYLAKGLAPLVGLGLSTAGADGSVIGASGAVFAVMVLFALKWPHRTILIWGLLPVPVWAMVAFDVLANVLGFLGAGEGAAVSFLAHLGGAAFALVWFRTGDVLEKAALQRRLAKAGKARAELDGDRREMDRILAKIQASGLGSLETREREFLERRSRQLRDQGR